MKIIGTTSGGYIAEITEGDLAAIIGETWLNGTEAKLKLKAAGVVFTYNDSPQLIGCTIPVHQRFRRMVDLESHHGQLGDRAKTLRALASLIDTLAESPLSPSSAPAS